MFFFQTMFQQVYNGITHSNTLNAVTTIAQGILLLCALFGVYEAYSRGGDARSLALVGVRFLFMGLVIAQYSTVFIAVNNAAANLANQISPNDVFATFRTEVGNWFWVASRRGKLVETGHRRCGSSCEHDYSSNRCNRISDHDDPVLIFLQYVRRNAIRGRAVGPCAIPGVRHWASGQDLHGESADLELLGNPLRDYEPAAIAHERGKSDEHI